MIDSFRYEIEKLLRSADIGRSVAAMSAWLATAAPGAPTKLLQDASPALRPKLALLMRDILTNLPGTVMGCPVLLWATPEEAPSMTLWPADVALPAAGTQPAPCNDLEFLGWVTDETKLPLPLPFFQSQHPTNIPWLKPTCRVALFKAHPDLYDLDRLEFPHTWWIGLLKDTPARIRLTSSLLLPYPDALEAAQVQTAVLRKEPPPENLHFLSDKHFRAAVQEALLFEGTCVTLK